jgi:DinB superfamily
MKQFITEHAAFVNQFLADMVSDIPDDQLADQPGGQINHPAWILGHLSTGRDRLGAFLDLQPLLAPSWKGKYGFGSTPTPNRADYGSKDELLELYLSGRTELIEAVSQADDSLFDQTIDDEILRPLFSTIGRFTVQALIAEPMFHLGQISAWRRAMGMPNVFDQTAAKLFAKR